jgi:hypothetical protein
MSKQDSKKGTETAAEASPDETFDIAVRGFRAKIPGRVRELSSLAKKEQWDAFAEVAHSLASASLFGMSDLGECARKLQSAANAGDLTTIYQLMSELDRLATEASKP